jgi:hypothetical protein
MRGKAVPPGLNLESSSHADTKALITEVRYGPAKAVP